jgi:predicted enzyme related to lactoylglutathione lyase
MAYFAVSDIEASVKKVQELGGKISVEISENPETGRFSVIHDPQGAILTIIESKMPQPWTE